MREEKRGNETHPGQNHHPSPKRSRLGRTVTLVVLAVAIPILSFSVLGRSLEIARVLIDPQAAANRDFVSYWAAGKLLLKHQNPYDPAAAQALERSVGYIPPHGVTMRNPPVALPPVLPLGALQVKLAACVWTAGIVVCIWLSLLFVRSMHGEPSSYLYLLGFVFPAVLCCVASGQLSAFLLLGVAAFLRLYDGRPLSAGVCLIVLAIKPQLFLPLGAVLMVWVVLRQRWTVLAGTLLAIAASLAISIPLRLSLWSDYLSMLRNDGIDRDLIAAPGSALRLLLQPQATWLQFVPAILGTAWAVWYFRRHRSTWDWRTHGLILLPVSLLAAPYTWFFDGVIALPAVLHGIYVSSNRQRAITGFAAISSVGAIQMFLGVPIYSGSYVWISFAWLIWYVWETRSGLQRRDFRSNTREERGVPLVAGSEQLTS